MMTTSMVTFMVPNRESFWSAASITVTIDVNRIHLQGDNVYLSGLTISNFRCFGEGKDSFELFLKPGLTAIVGQTDAERVR